MAERLAATPQATSIVRSDAEGHSAVSWAAVAAGAIAASATSLLLMAFGAGMGFSSVSPWAGRGVSGTTAGLVAGIYLLVAAMISSAIGGYIAGRLRTKWTGVHSDEVYFRDTAHGFLAWAFATCLTAAFLTTTLGALVGGGAALTGSVMQGGVASQGATGNSDYFVDALFRPAQPGAAPAGDVAGAKAQAGPILAAAVRDSDANAEDRTYLSQLVASRTGLSQADADKRVNDVINRAKAAADAARKAAAHFALWLTASLLLGAFCGSLAATEGGMLRDR